MPWVSSSRAVDDHPPLRHDQPHLVERLDARRRIAGHGEQVGGQTGGHTPRLLLEAEGAGGGSGASPPFTISTSSGTIEPWPFSGVPASVPAAIGTPSRSAMPKLSAWRSRTA